MGSDQMNFKEICTANFTGQHDQNYKIFKIKRTIPPEKIMKTESLYLPSVDFRSKIVNQLAA